MAKQEIEDFIKAENLTLISVFVPFSQSRNKGEKTPSLNWKVTLLRNGREVLSTDYMAGCAHCPGYRSFNQHWPLSAKECAALVTWECEHGVKGFVGGDSPNIYAVAPRKPLLPPTIDVLAALASDAGAIDYSSFEEWAPELGYDPNSRKAESAYRECLAIALALRNALGEDGLARLQAACQDY